MTFSGVSRLAWQETSAPNPSLFWFGSERTADQRHRWLEAEEEELQAKGEKGKSQGPFSMPSGSSDTTKLRLEIDELQDQLKAHNECKVSYLNFQSAQ